MVSKSMSEGDRALLAYNFLREKNRCAKLNEIASEKHSAICTAKDGHEGDCTFELITKVIPFQ